MLEQRMLQLEADIRRLDEFVRAFGAPAQLGLMRAFVRGSPTIGALFQRRSEIDGRHDQYAWTVAGGATGQTLPHTSKLFFDTTPANGDVRIFHLFPHPSELVSCRHRSTAGTIAFNLELRDFADWNTVAGTEVFASDKTIDSTETEETTFATGSIPAGTLLCVVFSGAASPADVGIILEWMENV